jgi:endonuclease YncB( thermonuclease family)
MFGRSRSGSGGRQWAWLLFFVALASVGIGSRVNSDHNSTSNTATQQSSQSPGSGSQSESQSNSEPKEKAMAIKILDGDTIRIKKSKLPKIRLLAIDAPEPNQCFGIKAQAALKRMIEKSQRLRVVYDSKIPKRQHGRSWAYLIEDRGNINIRMIKRGYALPYFIGKNGDFKNRIAHAHRRAKKQHLGLWGACHNDGREYQTTAREAGSIPR